METGDVGLGLVWILEAVGAGYCLELRHLGITTGIVMVAGHAEILGQILRDGARPLLEELNLRHNSRLAHDGLAHVMDAVELGAVLTSHGVTHPRQKIYEKTLGSTFWVFYFSVHWLPLPREARMPV